MKNYYSGYIQVKANLAGEGKAPRWHWIHVIREHTQIFGQDCIMGDRVNKNGDPINKDPNTHEVTIIGWEKDIVEWRRGFMNRTYEELEPLKKLGAA